MATPLSLHTGRRDDGTVLLSAIGELDLSNIDAFTAAFAAIVGNGTPDQQVTVDFTQVEYLDSGAINALFEHADRIRRIIVNPILMSVLTVSGLTSVATVEAAQQD
ncbi:STAS domain-containing protein [Mycobacterium sp. E740]|uniref:STAS domain-containing protein n=1 Tax=Mycobacterium sp. E740 TaxID=1834149 RepID=UPI0008006048|nr:STAS domain-containing protein [Mycobacterium sp. E740]OBI79266.1 anti-anti-sigma factor [Mycobacterium sp. E740]